MVPVQAISAGDGSVSLTPETWPEAPTPTPAFGGGWTQSLWPDLGWWGGRGGLCEGGAWGYRC